MIKEPPLHLENNRGKTENLEKLFCCPKMRVNAAGLPAPHHLRGALPVVTVPLAMVAGTGATAKNLCREESYILAGIAALRSL